MIYKAKEGQVWVEDDSSIHNITEMVPNIKQISRFDAQICITDNTRSLVLMFVGEKRAELVFEALKNLVLDIGGVNG